MLVPVLKDAHESGTTFGQLIIASGTIADFATVILLSLFFSREASSTTTKVVLLGGLFVVAVVVALAIAGVEHSRRLKDVLRRLQDTSAQIRVRGAFVLLIGLVALAGELGLEVILGAFIAGAIISLVDRDREMTHATFRLKLDAAGFGIFIPVFFVSTGVTYDLDALTSSTSTIMHVPVFLAALVAVRGLPALLYRPVIPRERIPVAILMQSTSLPFIVAATQVGLALDVVTPANAAALVAAGLLSVVLFPAASLVLLRRQAQPAARRLVVAPRGLTVARALLAVAGRSPPPSAARGWRRVVSRAFTRVNPARGDDRSPRAGRVSDPCPRSSRRHRRRPWRDAGPRTASSSPRCAAATRPPSSRSWSATGP